MVISSEGIECSGDPEGIVNQLTGIPKGYHGPGFDMGRWLSSHSHYHTQISQLSGSKMLPSRLGKSSAEPLTQTPDNKHIESIMISLISIDLRRCPKNGQSDNRSFASCSKSAKTDDSNGGSLGTENGRFGQAGIWEGPLIQKWKDISSD